MHSDRRLAHLDRMLLEESDKVLQILDKQRLKL
jgi:hypothetical protein